MKKVKRLKKRIKKILLLVLALLTLISLIHMIWVRASAGGYNLISMNSGTGWHIANWYIPSVVLFVVLAGILGIWLFLNYLNNKNKKKSEKQ